MFVTSASKIKDYMLCRRYYHDRHVLKTPQGKDTSAILGTAIHKAIEDTYNGGQYPYYTLQHTIGKELDYAHNNGIPVTYRQSYAEMIETGTEIIGGYDFTRFVNGTSEYAFELPLTEGVVIRGIIDRITEDGIVLDYKSGKRKPKDLSNDVQFTIYVWAYTQMFHKMPKKVYWYHLRTHELIEYSTAKLEAKMFDLIHTVTTMKNDTFADMNSAAGRCKNCVPWCTYYE